MEGSGVDFLTGNNRGEFLKDGSDFPLVSSLSLNNYLIISRHMDLEASIEVSYAHYPLGTQEDELNVNLTEEGVFATFSSEFLLARDMRLLVYDDILYRTDYIDTRGLEDRYGGQAYEYLNNTLGADLDWKLSPFDNLSLSASRLDQIPLDDEFDYQKGVIYNELAAYERQLAPFAVAGVQGTFSQSFYEDDSRPDVYMYGFGLFAGAQLMRTVSGSASLGYQFSTYEGEGDSGSNRGSLSGSLGLSHQISESKGQTLTYQRTQAEYFGGGVNITDRIAYGLNWTRGMFPGGLSTQYSSFDPQGAGSGFSDWSTTLSVSHRLTRLLNLNVSTSYAMRMNDSGAATDPDNPDLNSDYETWTVRMSTGMRLTRKTGLSAYAEHADRMSDNDNLAYTRDVIGATLTWTHKF